MGQIIAKAIEIPVVTVGMDVGDRYSYLCVLNESGAVLEEGRVPTTPDALRARFGKTDRVRIVIEAGTNSPWISRLLADCGHEVIVANARRVRLIYESDSKNDRGDAVALARLGRLDPALLSPIQHRGEAAQRDLALIRARDALVRTRTLLVNHVRGAVKSVGGRLPSCSTHSFVRQVREAIPEAVQEALAPVLATIESISREIHVFDKRVEELAKAEYPETALLRAVPGVGALTALCYVLTIEDPDRFANSRKVGAYLGLRPRLDKSGMSAPALRITKAGDVMLRHLLAGSAQYILGPFGPDTDLRRWGLKLAATGGKNAKKRAVVAVARKLAVLLHRLWSTGEVYEPLHRAMRIQAAEMTAV